MKVTTGILALAMTAGAAWAQNPDIIENTRNTMKAVEQKKAIDSNAALAASQGQATKPAAPAPKKAAAAVPVKPAPAKPSVSAVPAPGKGPAAGPGNATSRKAAPVARAAAAAKPAAKAAKLQVKAAAGAKPKASKPAKAVIEAKGKPSTEGGKPDKPEAKKIVLTGRRDPFVSPVVNHMNEPACSTGKKCLDIQQIALRGVVKAETGMIAVVVNSLNKAYFLRENDPVFNGYVMKITGDSIVFKETFQDKLGKSVTREVTKKITTPAV